jgi:hypothetical protein
MNVLKGTVTQGAVAALAPITLRTAAMGITLGSLPQDGYNFEWSDMLSGNSFGLLSDFYSPVPTSIPSILAIPNATLTFDIREAAMGFPAGGLTVKLPPPYIKLAEDLPVPPPVASPTPVPSKDISGTWKTEFFYEGSKLPTKLRMVVVELYQGKGYSRKEWEGKIYSEPGGQKLPDTYRIYSQSSDPKNQLPPGWLLIHGGNRFKITGEGTLEEVSFPGMKTFRTWRR